MSRGGGGEVVGGFRALVETGFSWDTWKTGCIFIEEGSVSRTADGFIILSTGNGPIYRGDSLRDSVLRGMFLDDNQTD